MRWCRRVALRWHLCPCKREFHLSPSTHKKGVTLAHGGDGNHPQGRGERPWSETYLSSRTLTSNTLASGTGRCGRLLLDGPVCGYFVMPPQVTDNAQMVPIHKGSTGFSSFTVVWKWSLFRSECTLKFEFWSVPRLAIFTALSCEGPAAAGCCSLQPRCVYYSAVYYEWACVSWFPPAVSHWECSEHILW